MQNVFTARTINSAYTPIIRECDIGDGTDKRKVFDYAELVKMMTECGAFAPDEFIP